VIRGLLYAFTDKLMCHYTDKLSGPVCADLQDIDIGLSGSSLAKTVYDEEGL